MGGDRNYDPFLGTLNIGIRCRIIIKGLSLWEAHGKLVVVLRLSDPYPKGPRTQIIGF